MKNISVLLWRMKTFMDMARLNPLEYGRLHETSFACPTEEMPPFVWHNGLLRAAEEQLSYLNDVDCPFQHSTCSKYCARYRDCTTDTRVAAFCPECSQIGENIIRGPRQPISVLRFFFEKEGHCANIFSFQHNALGVALSVKPTITVQNFAHAHVFSDNPIVSGTHYFFTSDDDDQNGGPSNVTFIVNYIDPETQVFVVFCGIYAVMQFYMFPSTYSLTATIDCDHYYFLSESLTHRLPEDSVFPLDE